MFGNGSFKQDPLDLARNQMDFARMSADAPGVKEILFKAQTIIPTTPSTPTWQKAGPAAGAAVLAGALFIPMLPSGSSLDKVTVNYENAMPPAVAQQIQFDVRNTLDANILMGSQFNAAEAPDSGRLILTFTAAGEPALLSTVTAAVDAASGESLPLMRASTEAAVSSRQSVVQMAMKLLSGNDDELSYIDSGNATASELLKHPDLLQQGLNAEFGRDGYSVSSVEFFNGQPLAHADTVDYRTLELECWPLPLRVEMNVNDMAAFEHEQLSLSAAAWLDSVNLGPAGNGLADRPGKLLPIMVEVRNPDGLIDRSMTERLQAVIVQPTPAEITDASTWDVKTAVEVPLKQLMGNRLCTVAYERVSDPSYNRDVNFFWIHVRIQNQFEEAQNISERVENLERTIDY
jgi:hypothetical protein